MEERDDKVENGEVERKKERVVVVYCSLFIILLCSTEYCFNMLFMNNKSETRK